MSSPKVASSSPAVLSTESQKNQLLEAISIPVTPVKRTSAYGWRIVWALLVMLAMIAGYGLIVTFLLAVFIRSCISGLTNYGSLLGFVFAGLPGFISLAVLVALLKPLFAKRDDDSFGFELQSPHEPLFFDFVSRLCRSVGAPPPASIVVDVAVNASAGYMRGLFDNRLRLTIGLPLVLGLDMRQLAGIMAHEFGHFRQVGGMKATYAIRSINQWFVEATFQRDFVDHQLAEWAQKSDLRFGWIIWLAQAAIYVARFLLMILIFLGHFFCAKLLREMEFEADRVETRLVGTRTFARTCRDMRMIELSHLGALNELDRYRRESRLPDNWPALIASLTSRIDAEKFREMEKKLLEVKTEWDDSHPSDRDRIENAAREQAEGTFTVELPATTLFTDFNGLARVVTLKWYQQLFGPKYDPKNIQDTSKLVEARKVEVTQGEGALRFILEQFCHLHTFYLPRFALGEAIESAQYKTNTQSRRDKLLKDVRGYAATRKKEEEWRENFVKVAVSRRLIEAGFDLSQNSALFPAKTLFQIQHRAAELGQEEKRLKSELKGFRQMLGYRLMDALEFLRAEKILTQIGEPKDVVADVKGILRALHCVINNMTVFEQSSLEHRVLAIQLMIAENHQDNDLFQSINQTSQRIQGLFETISFQCANISFPFDHGKGKISLAAFLLPERPNGEDVIAVLGALDDMEENLERFMKQSLGRLGSLAEKVESAFGFKPLETPPECKMS